MFLGSIVDSQFVKYQQLIVIRRIFGTPIAEGNASMKLIDSVESSFFRLFAHGKWMQRCGVSLRRARLKGRFGVAAAFHTSLIIEKRQLPLGVDGCLSAASNI